MLQAAYKLIFSILFLYAMIFLFRWHIGKKNKPDTQDPDVRKKRILYLVFILLSYLLLIIVLSNTLGRAF